MVVAHTNDFGVGPARPIFYIRYHISDRSIHLHAILIVLVTTYLIRFIYGSVAGTIFSLFLAGLMPLHLKEVATIILATGIVSIFLWEHVSDLLEFVWDRVRIIK